MSLGGRIKQRSVCSPSQAQSDLMSLHGSGAAETGEVAIGGEGGCWRGCIVEQTLAWLAGVRPLVVRDECRISVRASGLSLVCDLLTLRQVLTWHGGHAP
jgi:hypothetical protein